ncbi:MAG: MBOAT family protein [Candidatus Omnitrophota bacterium]|jgi:alginate O-acetyltransferase complex protein AlgI|nr:MAG: MBOAT family protein [Candidatus Omnitrophota bacterium]
MVFSTYIFLFVYLPLTLGVYYLLPFRMRAFWLTLTSYVFYGWMRPEYCTLLAAATLLNYYCGKRMVRAQTETSRKVWLTVAVAGSLGLLGFYKYAGMFTHWADTVAQLFVTPANGVNVIPILDIILPIGISFFTFQAISYPIDLYRGDAEEAPDLISFASYISMFPQLIAGPIVRYQWIAEELKFRTHTPAKFALGLRFFAHGLAKKVLLADMFALAVPLAFCEGQPTFELAWIGILGYTLQIYFDFAGYSDMAVGLGLMMGFTYPQNFNSPYKSASITEFWRRWHITLSTWLRDYLYIPLGGNRKGAARTYINLTIVMLLGGLWHGASIVFMLWGLWHGLLLASERWLEDKHPLKRMPRPLAVACTNLLVILSWVLFRAENFRMAGRILKGMFLSFPTFALGDALISPGLLLAIPIGMAICLFAPNSWEISPKQTPVLAMRDAAILLAAVTAVLATASTPFLYFQF